MNTNQKEIQDITFNVINEKTREFIRRIKNIKTIQDLIDSV